MEINNTTNSVLTGLLILVQIVLFDTSISIAVIQAAYLMPIVYLITYIIIKCENILSTLTKR